MPCGPAPSRACCRPWVDQGTGPPRPHRRGAPWGLRFAQPAERAVAAGWRSPLGAGPVPVVPGPGALAPPYLAERGARGPVCWFAWLALMARVAAGCWSTPSAARLPATPRPSRACAVGEPVAAGPMTLLVGCGEGWSTCSWWYLPVTAMPCQRTSRCKPGVDAPKPCGMSQFWGRWDWIRSQRGAGGGGRCRGGLRLLCHLQPQQCAHKTVVRSGPVTSFVQVVVEVVHAPHVAHAVPAVVHELLAHQNLVQHAGRALVDV